MKAYFIIQDFFYDALISLAADIRLKSYKINGVETLTTAYFVETQSDVDVAPVEWDYCNVNPDGSNPQADTTVNPNSFNPFAYVFKTAYNQVNGLYRGASTGTQNGHNYGVGVLNFGVDVPQVLSVGGALNAGAFFIDIDFTKSIYIEWDVFVGDTIPATKTRTYKLTWNPNNCYKNFSYYSYLTSQFYDATNFGFLKGIYQGSEPPQIDLSGNCVVDPADLDKCQDKVRTRSFALFAQLPTLGQSPEEVFKECCYTHIVLADADSTNDFKNDYTSVYHQRQLPGEVCNFFLFRYADGSEHALNNATYGVTFPFGYFATNPNLKGYLVQWKKVLAAHGPGTYKIIKRNVISGITYETSSFVFNLKQYSSGLANHTVRMDIIMDGLLESSGIDFTGTSWKHSIRVAGFFGRREPTYVEDNLITGDFEDQQISMKQTNEYKWQTSKIPDCVQEEILDFMLFANDIYMNDYNLNNTSYKYVKFAVKINGNEGTSYGSHTRFAKLNLTFKDKFVNRNKRNYN